MMLQLCQTMGIFLSEIFVAMCRTFTSINTSSELKCSLRGHIVYIIDLLINPPDKKIGC